MEPGAEAHPTRPTLLSGKPLICNRALCRPWVRMLITTEASWFCRHEPKLPKPVSDRVPHPAPESGRVQPVHDAAAVVQLR